MMTRLLLLTILTTLLAPQSARLQETGNSVMLVGSPGYPARDLFPLEFLGVDGRNIPPRDVLWVEPGKRRLKVRVPARYTESLIGQKRNQWPDHVVIELELEGGKIYQLRGRWNRTDRDHPYDIVIESVEDVEQPSSETP
ncbi:MAG: hypothetical protein Kow0020_08980 [Wenzhouxiangellaceae bacterium]